MSESWLECVNCGIQIAMEPRFRGCERCSVEFEVRYNFPKHEKPTLSPTRGTGVMRWANWLPEVMSKSSGLDEGNTPLLEINGNCPGLFLKNETRNPTWSWKDRPNAVTVEIARTFGFRRLAVISTGNHGVAAAAFAAAAGLECVVFCHEDAPMICTNLMAHYGAVVVRGGDRYQALERVLSEGDTFPGTTLDARPGFTNPFGVEGFKTIAFELIERLDGQVPHRVYVPTGSGDGVYGVWKGFRELHQAGVIDHVPAIVACQSIGADSLAQAFAAKQRTVTEIKRVTTRALSIGERLTGDHALRAVYESNGFVRTATDSSAITASRYIAGFGTAIELSSAVALACALEDAKEKPKDEVWVVIGSGAVTKWPDDLQPCSLPLENRSSSPRN